MPRWGTFKYGERTWGGYRSWSKSVADHATSPDVPDSEIARFFARPNATVADVAVSMSNAVTRHVIFSPVRPAPIPAELARVFLPLTYRMLDDMPPYEADEPMIRLFVDSIARELQRVIDTADLFRHQFWPQNADEDFKALSMWEGILGLPIQPDGIRPPARRSIVVAKLRARHVVSGKRWVELLTAMLGSENWSYVEGPFDYTVTITIPYSSGSWRAGRLIEHAREITPAHIAIDVNYSEGFILNESLLSSGTL